MKYSKGSSTQRDGVTLRRIFIGEGCNANPHTHAQNVPVLENPRDSQEASDPMARGIPSDDVQATA